MSDDARSADPYVAVQSSPEFQGLRKTFRNFVFPMTVFFLVWYFLYAILSVYASDFMNTFVFGKVSIGLIFGLLQFVSTFAITIAYARWANNKFDPAADKVIARLDAKEN